jgi:hypothetical protein
MPKPRAVPRVHRAWRTPDALWAEIEPLLPPGKPHPLGCHNPRVDDRRAMDASFFRPRTGCQWKLWRRGLTEYDALKGIDWRWLAADGAMTKAPLGGENHGAQSDGSRQAGHEAQRAHRGEPRPHRAGGRRRQPA